MIVGVPTPALIALGEEIELGARLVEVPARPPNGWLEESPGVEPSAPPPAPGVGGRVVLLPPGEPPEPESGKVGPWAVAVLAPAAKLKPRAKLQAAK